MTREELRDYIEEQRNLDIIPYHVYSTLIDGIDTLEQEPYEDWCDVPSNEMNLEQARHAVRDLRKELVEHLEQEPILDKIRAEINAILTNSYDEGVKEKALQIIDKTRQKVGMRKKGTNE